ncbi:MvdC/MvdD family ATP grasp protein [Nostoc sp.]|uniref:MvdC/MvdD family ATP grasp protein n=1 Tax=Nostoc sp. TaxID=1180 RepID=UPI002FFABF72
MHLARDVVLLITHSGDYFTIDRVAEAVSKLGAQPFRLDTDKFPSALQLQVNLSNSGSNHTLQYSDRSLNTEQVQAVWMRRIWQPEQLPDRLIRCLDAFMAKFGLIFGAFDLIKTPSGEYVFLEINPTGEWGMLEKDLDYPIALAIASALLSKNPK